MKTINSYLSFIALLAVGCKSLPPAAQPVGNGTSIAVAPGPEDFEMDASGTTHYPRLLVACDERREGKTQGSVWEINLETNVSKELPIVFSSPDVIFHPHGMSIFESYLFVISHRDKRTEEFFRFKIYADSLVQDTVFSKGLIGQGNDLFAVGKDEFYYSDFKAFGGSIVHYDGATKTYSKYLKHLNYPNGVWVLGDSLYVTESLANQVILYTGGKKTKIAKIKMPDNLLYDGTRLYTTSHPSLCRFIKHANKDKNDAPTVAYQIDLTTGVTRVLYSNSGDEIPASSAVWRYQNQLYLAQIFGGFVWKVTID